MLGDRGRAGQPQMDGVDRMTTWTITMDATVKPPRSRVSAMS